jgi:hypothetical protein
LEQLAISDRKMFFFSFPLPQFHEKRFRFDISNLSKNWRNKQYCWGNINTIKKKNEYKMRGKDVGENKKVDGYIVGW